MKWWLSIALLIFTLKSNGQTVHEGEAWLGYITTYKLRDKLYLWNDFHFVPGGFFVSRHGLSYRPNKRFNLTGGYAWVATSTSFTNRLERREHRPWGQIEYNTPIARKSSLRARIRYDARIRNRIAGNEVLDDYMFYSRLRVMTSYRFVVKKFSETTRTHFNVMNEFLVNAGHEVGGWNMDQNRVYLLGGFDVANLTILLGYHNRIIPAQAGGGTMKHGLTLWLVQTFGEKPRQPDKIITPEEVPQLY